LARRRLEWCTVVLSLFPYRMNPVDSLPRNGLPVPYVEERHVGVDEIFAL